MDRVTHNYGAGPASLPPAVVDRVIGDLEGDRGSGSSILEMSHRSDSFQAIASNAERCLRSVMGVPDDYQVLFLQGGATLQFAAIPLNLAKEGDTVDHLVTGHWSVRAAREAARYCTVAIAADGSSTGFRTIPDPSSWAPSDNAVYTAYAPNETIDGVEFGFVPDSGGNPLVADMSSTIMSRPIDVSAFGLIYAGAQKNLGIAGLTVVIVRDDLIGRARPGTPRVLDYSEMAATASMSNTPPVFAWYITGLVCEWIRDQGGLAALGERNRGRKDRLYDAIDQSELFRNMVDPKCRSWTNIPFHAGDAEIENAFLEAASAAGLHGLRGHRSVGGMRASLYNGLTDESVDALIGFIDDFEVQQRRKRR